MFKRKFPFFRQLDQMDCGAACLKMICSYYGKEYSIQFLRSKCGITRQGVSINGICDAAEEINLKSLPVYVDFDSLSEEVPLPCIVHWRQRHFIVIYKLNARFVWVSDPAHGRVKYTHAKFKEGWLYNKKTIRESENEGYAVLLEPAESFYDTSEPDQQKKKGLRFLLPYLKKYRPQVIQLVCILLLASLVQLFLPLLTRALVDKGISDNNLNFIYLVLAGQLMLFFSQTILEVTRRWIILFVSTRINISIISDFLLKMMRLQISFFDSKMLSDLVQRVDDQKQVEQFMSNTSLNVLFSLINFLLFGGILFYYNSTLFLIFVVGAAIYFYWVLLFVKKRARLSYIRRDESVENRSSILQIINGIEEIKLNNSVKKRRWEWESVQARVSNTAMKELRLEQFQVVGGNFVMQITYIIITFIAAISVVKGEITLGMMLATQFIIGQLSVPVTGFVSFIQGAQEARISIERLGEVLNQQEENDETQLSEIKSSTAAIRLHNVSFRYGTHSTPFVLENINMTIARGKVTAIVGTSGSGKTTLLKLLTKFYDPTEGSITLGTQNLSAFNSDFWRSQCGVVMQNGFIFADTILRNITESDPGYEIDKEKLGKAVGISNIGQLIEKLPLGYNTNLSWGGIDLSGGENQRILIARAVYKNPEFILFDEATSSLDANNEKIIMENLEEFFRNRTVVIIAHRLSTVKNADKIIVLESGRIIEEGTHKNLVERKGSYFKLVKNQLELGT